MKKENKKDPKNEIKKENKNNPKKDLPKDSNNKNNNTKKPTKSETLKIRDYTGIKWLIAIIFFIVSTGLVVAVNSLNR